METTASEIVFLLAPFYGAGREQRFFPFSGLAIGPAPRFHFSRIYKQRWLSRFIRLSLQLCRDPALVI